MGVESILPLFVFKLEEISEPCRYPFEIFLKMPNSEHNHLSRGPSGCGASFMITSTSLFVNLLSASTLPPNKSMQQLLQYSPSQPSSHDVLMLRLYQFLSETNEQDYANSSALTLYARARRNIVRSLLHSNTPFTLSF